jgi:hypothetical protein
MKGLKQLVLSINPLVTAAGLDELKKALHDCKIYY